MGYPKRGFKLKKLVFLGLLVVAVGLMAAAPSHFGYYNKVRSKTINGPIGGAWTTVDSLITVVDDSGFVLITVTGVARLDPGERLYLGIGNDSANCVDSATCAGVGVANSNIDTVLFQAPQNTGNPVMMPFSHIFAIDTVNASTTDTVYLNAAKAGTGVAENVQLTDVVMSAVVVDIGVFEE